MSMHDIWNPWHGCRKCSEGCAHCYMYYLDGLRGQGGFHLGRGQRHQARPGAHITTVAPSSSSRFDR